MSILLNDDNFDEYAVSHYFNPNCISVLEFLDKVDEHNHDILNAFLLFLKYIDAENLDYLDLGLYNELKKKI